MTIHGGMSHRLSHVGATGDSPRYFPLGNPACNRMLVSGADQRTTGGKRMARRGKSGRRANGEGTVYIRRDGRPEARYTVATPSGSKRKTITGRKGQTKEDLATEMRRRLVAAEGRVFTDEENLALGEYIDRWLQDSVRDTVRQRTYERYEQMVRVHVKPALGHVKLTKLHPGLIRGLYRERLDSGLAPRTVQYIHVTLRKALAQAVSDGLVARNATDGVKAPRPRKKEMNPLSGDQARAFLAAAREGERPLRGVVRPRRPHGHEAR